MKTKILSMSIILLSLLINNGCKEDKSTNTADNSTAIVVVKTSNTNYSQESIHRLFPDSASLAIISSAYSTNYSEERRAALIATMKKEVSELGEDVTVIDTILTRAGCNSSGEYILPTYAEKAKYNGIDAWLIQFTYGLGNSGFGHYKCYAFSVPSLDTLNYVGCK